MGGKIMYLTVETLQKHGACQDMLTFFAKHYPDGADMKHIIEKGHLPAHALHWGYINLAADPEDIEAYFKKMKITNSNGVFNSEDVSDSEAIQESQDIHHSSSIYKSKHVEHSQHITGCEEVYHSHHINLSNFVENSERVKNSNNITDCSDIVDTTYAVQSHQIIGSRIITNCYDIRNSLNLQDCAACADCSDSQHLLFCQGIQNSEYMLFNKPIAKEQFDIIRRQYQRYAPLTTVMEPWPPYSKEAPHTINHYGKQYEATSESFWRWVATLPNYDPFVLYQVTFRRELLTKN